jgi:hypothetical protein
MDGFPPPRCRALVPSDVVGNPPDTLIIHPRLDIRGPAPEVERRAGRSAVRIIHP